MIVQSPQHAMETGQSGVLRRLTDALAYEFVASDVVEPEAKTIRLKSREDHHSSGWCDISLIRSGLFVTSADVSHEAPVERRYGGSDLLKFHFCISGGCHIDGDDGGSSDIAASSLVCFTQPVDSEKREFVQADVHERSVTLSCSRDFVADIVTNCSLSLPQLMLDFACGKPLPFLCEQLPLPQQVRLIAEDLINVRTSPFEWLLREARSLELLTMALTYLAESSEMPPLRDRDHERVRQICVTIEGEGSYLHSIKELSRLVAWNETQMMDCFKRITGATISSYRQRHRMQAAIGRLRDSDVSITELAFDLGYEHPGNFATAFKKTFGFSPKAARSLRQS